MTASQVDLESMTTEELLREFERLLGELVALVDQGEASS